MSDVICVHIVQDTAWFPGCGEEMGVQGRAGISWHDKVASAARLHRLRQSAFIHLYAV